MLPVAKGVHPVFCTDEERDDQDTHAPRQQDLEDRQVLLAQDLCKGEHGGQED